VIAGIVTSALDARELHASAALPSRDWLCHRAGLDAVPNTELSVHAVSPSAVFQSAGL